MSDIKLTIGRLLNKIPYLYVPKIGGIYHKYETEIKEYEQTTDKREWIFQRVYAIVKFALENINFYQDFYKAKGFSLDQLRAFDDIAKIPIITKQDLMNVPLEDRSVDVSSRYVANTGGSSGMPLTFYKLKSSRIKEMVYYHHGWKRYGYDKSKIRLQFVGRQPTSGCVYELARNEIRVSVYEPFENVLRYLSDVNKNGIVEFLQGYPSVIYEFALYCSHHLDAYDESGLKTSLKALFLNSEYPHPTYRKKMEEVFGVKSIAGFGHTESICLGLDFGDGDYEVQQSYGYSECVEMSDGKHLVGTTYDNFASPLIRYDTNDLMDEIVVNDGILHTFKMTSGGRNGQYVVDRSGKKISLTGLIFGKHHDLFKYCSQLQISQSEKGKAKIYYVPIVELPTDFNPNSLFDAGDIDMDFVFKSIPKPIKTKAGKVLLMIKEDMVC